LVAGGIDLNTADMTFEVLSSNTTIHMGFYKEMNELYPEYYKPCWSEGKLRTMISDYGYLRTIRGDADVNRLIPILLGMQTMKECREKMRERQEKFKGCTTFYTDSDGELRGY
jgi:hypothetical protein